MNRSLLHPASPPALALALVLLAPEARAGEPLAVAAPAPSPVGYSAAYGAPLGAPPGHHYEQKRFLAPIIGGSVTLGLGYVASVVTGVLGVISSLGFSDGGVMTSYGPMLVPIAGPFLTLGVQPELARSDGLTAALVAMGSAQVVGATFLIIGLAVGKQTVLVPDEVPRDMAFSVRPVVGPRLGGMLVSATF